MLEWLQTSSLADSISQSQMILATLSSVHLLGLTLVMSAMLVSNLRVLGAVFATVPLHDIQRPASRMLALGLSISVITGFLLFMPRAAAAVENQTFRMKLLLIAGGVAVHSLIVARSRAAGSSGRVPRVLGMSALVLWVGAALAGCAFILLE